MGTKETIKQGKEQGTSSSSAAAAAAAASGCDMSDSPERKKPSVCRQLFDGPENGSRETSQQSVAEMKNEVKKLSDKYNYDFEKGEPKDGRWEWRSPEEDFENSGSANSGGNLTRTMMMTPGQMSPEVIPPVPTSHTVSNATDVHPVTSAPTSQSTVSEAEKDETLHQTTVSDFYPCKKHNTKTKNAND